MGLFHWLITHIAPIFIVSSPITSYADQIYAIHRTRSSSGFSLDIPLIMLVASILKTFYWLGARYDTSLLLQALLMIIVQILLLHVALSNRAPPTSSSLNAPFANVGSGSDGQRGSRPYNFWQWQSSKPYWHFLAYFAATLTLLTLLLRDSPSGQAQGGLPPWYTSALGYTALAIEAALPIPQLLANARRKSCVGFRLSVLVNWLLGDAFKMTFFFLKDSTDVPWAFKACGLFQAACDVGLGVQYAVFGNARDGVIGLRSSASDANGAMVLPAWERKEEEMGFVPVGQPIG